MTAPLIEAVVFAWFVSDEMAFGVRGSHSAMISGERMPLG